MVLPLKWSSQKYKVHATRGVSFLKGTLRSKLNSFASRFSNGLSGLVARLACPLGRWRCPRAKFWIKPRRLRRKTKNQAMLAIKQANKQTSKQTSEQSSKQTNQTNTQASKQANKQPLLVSTQHQPSSGSLLVWPADCRALTHHGQRRQFSDREAKVKGPRSKGASSRAFGEEPPHIQRFPRIKPARFHGPGAPSRKFSRTIGS